MAMIPGLRFMIQEEYWMIIMFMTGPALSHMFGFQKIWMNN